MLREGDQPAPDAEWVPALTTELLWGEGTWGAARVDVQVLLVMKTNPLPTRKGGDPPNCILERGRFLSMWRLLSTHAVLE